MENTNYLNIIIAFAFNYTRPELWIKHIAGNDSILFAHYLRKWNDLCDRYPNSATAFLWFCYGLDDSASNRMFEYIKQHYKIS